MKTSQRQRKVKTVTAQPHSCPEIMIVAYKYMCEVRLHTSLIKKERSYYAERSEGAPRNRYHGLERTNHFILISQRFCPPPRASPN